VDGVCFPGAPDRQSRHLIFALSVLFVFLVLAPNMSWSLPLSIVLIVPMSILRAGRASRGAAWTTTS
jgi:hypothetical protein